MQVIVESRSAEGSALRSVAESRLRFVLRRLAWQIPKARLRLSDINGPRGGEDKEVQVELQLAGAPPVVVSAKSRDWRAALNAALARASQRLVRTVRRARQAAPPRSQRFEYEAV
ncbi:MAG: HPF/RaiA family ribosome-associated protein [Methyloversatilis sp.]|jgi:putative sigma-54 modulation protein|nr:HPF/RaiA family ribosome-associated protein [Methyloversatilis sp.]MBP6194838.1 HPF/RaiA family ribosome-associated protein [Methyloversatilis sp.]